MTKKYVPYEQTLGALVCPWCGANGSAYCEGSYVDGWIAFVECSNSIKCGARGPSKRTGARSNDEHNVLEQAIKVWNAISKLSPFS